MPRIFELDADGDGVVATGDPVTESLDIDPGPVTVLEGRVEYFVSY